jgi:hypothetical protein
LQGSLDIFDAIKKATRYISSNPNILPINEFNESLNNTQTTFTNIHNTCEVVNQWITNAQGDTTACDSLCREIERITQYITRAIAAHQNPEHLVEEEEEEEE